MKQGLLFIALMIVLRPVFPLVDYVVNYHYIATELCVNKDRPGQCCHGKCYLKKNLAAAADAGKSATPVQKNEVKVPDWIACGANKGSIVIRISSRTPRFHYGLMHSEQSKGIVWRPPCIIV